MGFARAIKWIKIPVFLLCLVPLANLVWKGFHRDLTANPLEYIRNSTGFWTLVFLCVTLAVTPLRRLLHRNELIRFRRMLGLFAFFYSVLHFVTYIWFEQSFDLAADAGRRGAAAVHHGGVHRVCADDSAGADFDQRDGAAAGREALAMCCTGWCI